MHLSEDDIRRLVDFHLGRIAHATNALRELRKECHHTGLVGVFRADTGNWCESEDTYWVEFDCPSCGARWSEPQAVVRFHQGVWISKDGCVFNKKEKKL